MFKSVTLLIHIPFSIFIYSFLAQLSRRLKQNLSVVCRSCLWKVYDNDNANDKDDSSSFPEPLGQFQLNLAQNILGWRKFKFVQMKGPTLFQKEIITK